MLSEIIRVYQIDDRVLMIYCENVEDLHFLA
jgi:hypothetical protein